MIIGQRIKMLRKQKNLTQKKLAELSGIAEITIRNYEAGKYVPKTEQLNKIATVFNAPPNLILGIQPFDNLDYLLENKDSIIYIIAHKKDLDIKDEDIPNVSLDAYYQLLDNYVYYMRPGDGNTIDFALKNEITIKLSSDDLLSIQRGVEAGEAGAESAYLAVLNWMRKQEVSPDELKLAIEFIRRARGDKGEPK